MRYIKKFNIFESSEDTQVSIPSDDKIIKMLRKNFANYTNPGSKFPVEVKNKKGETIKTLEFYFDNEGELHIKENLSEGNFTKGLAALCLIGGMLTSCKKDDVYNIGSDARFRLHPKILGDLGKPSFDNPNTGKQHMYIWAGNQGGNGTRHGYYEFSNDSNKRYGTIYSEYPDSFGYGDGWNVPNEVLKVVETDKTVYPLTPEQKSKYKYIVLVKVHPSTKWDWSDINKEKEVPFEDIGTGYSLYLTNLETIKPGDLYPSWPTTIYYNFPKEDSKASLGIIRDRNKIVALKDYGGHGRDLEKDEPVI
jgi:hypothetical protein